MEGLLSMSTIRSLTPGNLALMTGVSGHLGNAVKGVRPRGLLGLSGIACAAATLGACTHSSGGREMYLSSRADPIEVIEIAGESRVVSWPWMEGDVGTFAALPGSGSHPLASRLSRAAEFVGTVQPLP